MKISSLNSASFTSVTTTRAKSSSSPYFDVYQKSNQKSALKFLKQNQMSPDSAFKFLCNSTCSETTSDTFVRELSSDPRKADDIKGFLITKLNGNDPNFNRGYDMFMTWFHDEKTGYRIAYQRYYEDKIWSKTKNIHTLLKQSPNLAPWALEKKFSQLNKEFIFGRVPDEFQNIRVYRKIIDDIKHTQFYFAFINARDMELGIKNINTLDLMTSTNQYLEQLAYPITIEAGKKKYIATPLIKSFSSKLIYEIVPEDDKTQKFILKFDPYQIIGASDRAVKFSENQDLRPDMPYLDAMIDFYLKDNNSKNAPDILLYDHDTKSVLYRATEGKVPEIPEKYLNNLYLFVNYDKIKDIKKLGVELNDAHKENFIEDKDGVYKLIDSGHVKFANVFRPPVVSKHIVTGNLCGRELCK